MEESLMQQLLNALNVSQKELADAAGLTKGNINHFATGRRPITAEAALKIQGAYPNVNLRWLVFGEGPMFLEEKPTDEELKKRLKEKEEEVIRLAEELEEKNVTEEGLRELVKKLKEKK